MLDGVASHARGATSVAEAWKQGHQPHLRRTQEQACGAVGLFCGGADRGMPLGFPLLEIKRRFHGFPSHVGPAATI